MLPRAFLVERLSRLVLPMKRRPCSIPKMRKASPKPKLGVYNIDTLASTFPWLSLLVGPERDGDERIATNQEATHTIVIVIYGGVTPRLLEAEVTVTY
jgi:hypothetical protein